MTSPRGEQGESLLELLIAVAIMGIAVIAIMAGLVTSVLISDVHRKQATAGNFVRDYAEAIQTWVANGNYGTTADSYSPGGVSFAIPPGTGMTASVDALSCWNGTGWQSCTLGDTGLQRIDLKVTDDHRATARLVTVVRKP